MGFLCFLGAGDLKSAVTFEISVPKFFFFKGCYMKTAFMKFNSTFMKLRYSLGLIERNLKMEWVFCDF